MSVLEKIVVLKFLLLVLHFSGGKSGSVPSAALFG
jgi:hypothetical protein